MVCNIVCNLWKISINIFPMQETYKSNNILLNNQTYSVVTNPRTIVQFILFPLKLFEIRNLSQTVCCFYRLDKFFETFKCCFIFNSANVFQKTVFKICLHYSPLNTLKTSSLLTDSLFSPSSIARDNPISSKASTSKELTK